MNFGMVVNLFIWSGKTEMLQSTLLCSKMAGRFFELTQEDQTFMTPRPDTSSQWSRAEALGLLMLSAASLAFEINLTRLFSVAQFYHFAFMIVSIALLGFGASGTFLAIFPSLGQNCPGQNSPRQSTGWLALATSATILSAYLLINNLPFDSFQIAWEGRRVAILVAHYFSLMLPFFFSGMAVGRLLSAYPQAAGSTYATKLIGSALGCGLALVCLANKTHVHW